MAGKKMRSNKTRKSAYDSYQRQDRAAKNKAARMERHLRKHPNDEQTQKNAVAERKRKNPSDTITHRNIAKQREQSVAKARREALRCAKQVQAILAKPDAKHIYSMTNRLRNKI